LQCSEKVNLSDADFFYNALLKNPGSAPDMHDQNLNYKFNLTSKIGSSVVVDLLVLQTLSSLTRLRFRQFFAIFPTFFLYFSEKGGFYTLYPLLCQSMVIESKI
jgi:hypothetical protein